MKLDWDYDPERYPRMGMLLKKKRESNLDAGFFEIIHLLYQFDFLDVDSALVDRMLWSRIALRSPSPIVVNTHDEEEGVRLTYEERVELARMMYGYYRVKWEKQKAVVAIEYDPIHNYLDEWSDQSAQENSGTGSKTTSGSETDMTTYNTQDQRTDNLSQVTDKDTTNSNTRTDDLTQVTDEEGTNSNTRTLGTTELTTNNLSDSSTKTDNLLETKTYGKTTTRTDNLTETDSGSSGSKEHMIQAFNSTQYKASDKDIFTGENSNTKTNTGTQGTVEGGSDSKANTGTESTQGTKTGTVNVAESGTIGDSGSDTRDVTVTNTGTRSDSGSGTEDVTVTNTGTQTNAKTGTVTEGKQIQGTVSTTESGSVDKERSGIHSGNIGNLTSQKMITEEIALWKWNFIEEVLSDATDFLTLQVYC